MSTSQSCHRSALAVASSLQHMSFRKVIAIASLMLVVVGLLSATARAQDIFVADLGYSRIGEYDATTGAVVNPADSSQCKILMALPYRGRTCLSRMA